MENTFKIRVKALSISITLLTYEPLYYSLKEKGTEIVVITKCLVNSDINHCYNPNSKHWFYITHVSMKTF